MFQRGVLAFALLAILIGGTTLWTPNVKAARCTSSDGITSCVGECCGAGATTCWAAPCDWPGLSTDQSVSQQ